MRGVVDLDCVAYYVDSLKIVLLNKNSSPRFWEIPKHMYLCMY